ncbi:MAG TPA: zinc ribbon domain-containing protein [Baekduia sp.]|nr:zinc ribbon domain-containing protein [Baekduia sp.]
MPPQPAAPTAEALPAGLAPEDVAPTRPSFRDRGRLRRRLRYLRRVRELGFRDLGGLAFDLHRFRRRNDELVLGKLAALDAVDRELRAIERVLDERRDIIELREPGIAACPRCGALHGSDANFCPQCGTQFSGPRAMMEVGGAPAPADPSSAVAPAQEALPLSAAEQGTTPVSGALAGNPPPPAPPVEPAVGEQATTVQPGASGETPGGAAEQPTTVQRAASDDAATTQGGEGPAGEATPGNAAASGVPDQPTQAFPAVRDDANGNGTGQGAQGLTSGDPLASRERSE